MRGIGWDGMKMRRGDGISDIRQSQSRDWLTAARATARVVKL